MRLLLHILLGIICATQVLVVADDTNRQLTLQYTSSGVQLIPEDNNTSCDTLDHVKASFQGFKLCASSRVWEEDFSTHAEELLQGNDLSEKWVLALCHFGRSTKYKYWDKKNLETMLQKLPESVIDKIPPVLVNFVIPYLADYQVGYINGTTIRSAMTGISAYAGTDPEWARDVINNLGEEIQKDHGGLILEQIRDVAPHLIHHISDTALGNIVSNTDNCKKITTKLLMEIGRSSSHASQISSSCAAEITLVGAECNGNLKAFPEFFKKQTKPIPDNCIKHMSPAQVETLGSESDERCELFQFEHLKDNLEAAAKVDSTCFANRLGKIPDRLPELGKMWTVFKNDIFAKITKDNISDISKVNAKDFRHISLEKLKGLIAEPSNCDSLPLEVFQFHTGLEVSEECFRKAGSLQQATILVDHILPATATRKLSSTDVKDWKYTFNDKQLVGLQVLIAASRVANISELVKNLSAENTDHACSSIQKASELKGNLVLQRYATESCIAAISGISNDDWKTLSPRLQAMQPFDDIRKNMKDDDWKKISVERLTYLSSSGLMCKKLDARTFHIINPSSLKAFDKKCVSEFTFLNEITSEEIKLLANDAFALFDSALVTRINVDHLTDAQFALLGADVKDISRHPASTFNQARIESLSASRIKLIKSPIAWAAVPVEGYKGLNEEKFLAIEPDAMVDMRLEQLSQVPPEVLAKITVKQMEMVGANYKGEKKGSPLAAFSKDIRSNMSKGAREVWEKRNDATALMPTVLSTLLILATIITISVA